MACCFALGSLGSMAVASGSRVASPPPKPLPSPECTSSTGATAAGPTAAGATAAGATAAGAGGGGTVAAASSCE
eukprot:scaffold68128_cov63-Phaeocystis_antarctica.AAC.1